MRKAGLKVKLSFMEGAQRTVEVVCFWLALKPNSCTLLSAFVIVWVGLFGCELKINKQVEG